MLPFNVPFSTPHIILFIFSIGQSNAGSLLLWEHLGLRWVCFISSIDSNRVHFKADLIFEKRKESQGAKSGEYGACSGARTRTHTRTHTHTQQQQQQNSHHWPLSTTYSTVGVFIIEREISYWSNTRVFQHTVLAAQGKKHIHSNLSKKKKS